MLQKRRACARGERSEPACDFSCLERTAEGFFCFLLDWRLQTRSGLVQWVVAMQQSVLVGEAFIHAKTITRYVEPRLLDAALSVDSLCSACASGIQYKGG